MITYLLIFWGGGKGNCHPLPSHPSPQMKPCILSQISLEHEKKDLSVIFVSVYQLGVRVSVILSVPVYTHSLVNTL